MKIRFQADNDLHEDILRSAKRLRPAIDFQRAPELGLHTGIDDSEVLRLCAEQNRMLVTHDRHTMPDHFIGFIRDHDSPGIFIVSRKLPIGKAAQWLVLYWEASEAEEVPEPDHLSPLNASADSLRLHARADIAL